MVQNIGGQPILVLPEGTLRTMGKDAQRVNIAAARAVADSVRSTLGPKGMDKMLVDGVGDIVISNDGVTILEEMEIDHPAAKMMVEVSKTQNQEVGDGTTTAVVIAGELLKRAEDLLEQDIHPTVIIKGYRAAKQRALEVLEKIALPVTINDNEILKKIALTAMTGKGSEAAKEPMAKIAVDAVRTVAEKHDGKVSIDMDNIKIEKATGGSMDDSELIKGIVIDKEKVHSGMPTNVTNARIALVDAALEIKETETDAEIRITSPEQMQAFLEQESRMLKEMVEKISASGANVLLCQKGIDDVAQHYLAKRGILAIRRVKKSDMEKLAKATGARIVSSLQDLAKEDLGSAGIVEERKLAGEHMIFVRDCKDPKAVTILIRGSTQHVVEEAVRAMDDAARGVAAAIEVGKVVIGGGATEIEVARQLKEYAEQMGGREQLAINAFADAFEIIPRTLAESSGVDAIDILVELRALHENGKTRTGVDVINGKVADMYELNVIEPLKIKTQALKSAGEAAEMILRIDDVISASKLHGGGGMPQNQALGEED